MIDWFMFAYVVFVNVAMAVAFIAVGFELISLQKATKQAHDRIKKMNDDMDRANAETVKRQDEVLNYLHKQNRRMEKLR